MVVRPYNFFEPGICNAIWLRWRRMEHPDYFGTLVHDSLTELLSKRKKLLSLIPSETLLIRTADAGITQAHYQPLLRRWPTTINHFK